MKRLGWITSKIFLSLIPYFLVAIIAVIVGLIWGLTTGAIAFLILALGYGLFLFIRGMVEYFKIKK